MRQEVGGVLSNWGGSGQGKKTLVNRRLAIEGASRRAE